MVQAPHFCCRRCLLSVPVSTAVAPAGLSTSVSEEALAVLRELTGRPDAAFREGQDVAVAALVGQGQRALGVPRTGGGAGGGGGAAPGAGAGGGVLLAVRAAAPPRPRADAARLAAARAHARPGGRR